MRKLLIILCLLTIAVNVYLIATVDVDEYNAAAPVEDDVNYD